MLEAWMPLVGIPEAFSRLKYIELILQIHLIFERCAVVVNFVVTNNFEEESISCIFLLPISEDLNPKEYA